MKKWISFSLLFIWGTVQSLAQCPACKTALESNREDGSSNIGNGINDGILYLLGAPYILVMVVALVWYSHYRNKKAQDKAQQA